MKLIKKISEPLTLKFEFDDILHQCPICQGTNLEYVAFISNKSFLSIEGFSYSRCWSCNCYFMNPQPKDESMSDFYNSANVEDTIEQSILEASANRYLNPNLRDYFFKNRIEPLLPYLKKVERILDIGCGVGVFVRYMHDLGYNVEGIDVSKCSVSFGHNKLNLGHLTRVSDWTTFKPRKKYDLVTAWTVIEHLKDPYKFVKYAKNLLHSEGFLLTEFPTVDSLLFELLKENFFWVMPPYHQFLISPVGMKVLLERCGFRIVEEYRMPKNWYFVNSVCRKLGLDYSSLINNPDFEILCKEIDSLFDGVALKLGKTSSMYIIAQLVY
jgi:SAM-dependent methyltransferase